MADQSKQPELEGMPEPAVWLVAFGHKAQSGKDTAAEILVGEYGWTQLSFAGKVKELAAFVNPIIDGHRVRLDSGLLRVGMTWDEAKKFPEVRRFLQFLGEGARQVLGRDVWVDPIRDQIMELCEDVDQHPGIVITDVRYTNEADMIRSLGGKLVRVDRDGAGAGQHSSETDLDDYEYDIVIDNNHSKDLLWLQVEALIGALSKEEFEAKVEALRTKRVSDGEG